MFLFKSDVAVKHVTLPILSAVMLVGNGMLIYVMAKHKNLRTVTNYFVMSLALSDGLMGSIIIPLLVLAEEGALGGSPEVCLVVFCIGITQVLVSCLTLTSIALERYFAIMRPLKHHAWMTTRNACLIIVCCWTYAVFIGCLPLMGWNALPSHSFFAGSGYRPMVQALTDDAGDISTLTVGGVIIGSSSSSSNDTSATAMVNYSVNCNHRASSSPGTTTGPNCTANLPDSMNSNHVVNAINGSLLLGGRPLPMCRYQMVIRGSYAAFMYPGHFVPLWVVLFVLYGQIYFRSRNQGRGHRRLSSTTSTLTGKSGQMKLQMMSSRRAKENWRALRILTVLVGYFLCSWLPVVIWYCLLYRGFSVEYAYSIEPTLPYWFYNVGITLAFGNSAVNPFLYGLGNRSVRNAWVMSFSCKKGARKGRGYLSTYNTETVLMTPRESPVVGYSRQNSLISTTMDSNVIRKVSSIGQRMETTTCASDRSTCVSAV